MSVDVKNCVAVLGIFRCHYSTKYHQITSKITKQNNKTPNTCGGIDSVANQQRTKDENVFFFLNPSKCCTLFDIGMYSSTSV